MKKRPVVAALEWRNTRIRKGIMEVLAGAKAPVSVVEILRQLERKSMAPNKTTVYRDMEMLAREGVVLGVDFGDRTKRYELAEGDHHHHLICRSCGKVEDIVLGDNLVSQRRLIARKSGFVVESHNLEFFGRCKTCA